VVTAREETGAIDLWLVTSKDQSLEALGFYGSSECATADHGFATAAAK
jgi:hypothetical protein